MERLDRTPFNSQVWDTLLSLCLYCKLITIVLYLFLLVLVLSFLFASFPFSISSDLYHLVCDCSCYHEVFFSTLDRLNWVYNLMMCISLFAAFAFPPSTIVSYGFYVNCKYLKKVQSKVQYPNNIILFNTVDFLTETKKWQDTVAGVEIL